MVSLIQLLKFWLLFPRLFLNYQETYFSAISPLVGDALWGSFLWFLLDWFPLHEIARKITTFPVLCLRFIVLQRSEFLLLKLICTLLLYFTLNNGDDLLDLNFCKISQTVGGAVSRKDFHRMPKLLQQRFLIYVWNSKRPTRISFRPFGISLQTLQHRSQVSGASEGVVR